MPFVQAEVRIIYGMDDDGRQVIATTYTADGVDDSVPDYFTGLTMFEVAKIDFLRRHGIIGADPSA
ncbi:hypothetical protein [Mycolicibacterium wolinskyi]|uniref:hypothetical protein n=1 Tax=Mycolicibacterium wolinskyi TaxID=59750 RepID=UPI003917A23E